MTDEAQAIQFSVVQLITWGLGVFLAFVGQGVGLVIVFAKYLGTRFSENTAALNTHAAKFEGKLDALRSDVVAELKHLADRLTRTMVGHERLEARVEGLGDRLHAIERRYPGTRGSSSPPSEAR